MQIYTLNNRKYEILTSAWKQTGKQAKVRLRLYLSIKNKNQCFIKRTENKKACNPSDYRLF